eukprot:3233640-Pyramimonas_sp.AAC.1
MDPVAIRAGDKANAVSPNNKRTLRGQGRVLGLGKSFEEVVEHVRLDPVVLVSQPPPHAVRLVEARPVVQQLCVPEELVVLHNVHASGIRFLRPRRYSVSVRMSTRVGSAFCTRAGTAVWVNT